MLDVDVQSDGDATLAVLEEEHGELPATWTVRTPSGGWHFWFRTLEPHRTRIGFAPGLELRGVGAYVVTAPSPGYVIETRHTPASAPAWLLDLAAGGELSGHPPTSHNIPTAPRYVRRAIELETAAIADAPPGTRNHTLNRAAFALARFVAAGHADADEVFDALSDAAAHAGLGPREIERTIRSAFAARQISL